MAKYFGKIGFAESVENVPGVYEEVITERSYFGDVLSNYRSLKSADQVNDNVDISKKISIVSDPYADLNFHAIRYVEYMGAKWKATSVEPLFPRLILTLGGLYNG